MGPTGIGKSTLALVLAEKLSAEIVSVDSAMIYRGMDIGTAKPTAAERARVPHHLIDIRDPSEPYSAAEFARDASRAIADIHARGKTAILVGGTFLYFRALIDGLSPMPASDAQVREAIRSRAQEAGWESLHRELEALDPAAAARIHPRDRQRLERALELHRLSGRPPSELHEAQGEPAPFDFVKYALLPENRTRHASRLGERFESMLAVGFADEVRALRARGNLAAHLPSMRALGYRQLWGWLEGDYDYEEAKRRAVVATRRYAKRQLTWLRGETDCRMIRMNTEGVELLLGDLLKRVDMAPDSS